MLKVKLIKEEFDENMKNKGSKEFQDMAERITTQVSESQIGLDNVISTNRAQRSRLFPVNICQHSCSALRVH